MKISIDEARHIANLAELEIAESELSALAADMARIVTLVDQLPDASSSAQATVGVGPTSLRLREDVVDPVLLTRPPEANAPAWQNGFFVVPALDGLGDE